MIVLLERMMDEGLFDNAFWVSEKELRELVVGKKRDKVKGEQEMMSPVSSIRLIGFCAKTLPAAARVG